MRVHFRFHLKIFILDEYFHIGWKISNSNFSALSKKVNDQILYNSSVPDIWWNKPKTYCNVVFLIRKIKTMLIHREIKNFTFLIKDFRAFQVAMPKARKFILDYIFSHKNDMKRDLINVRVFFKVWVAKVRARTHTCDVRSHMCVCVRNPFWKVCGMCMRAARFWACDVRPYFFTLLEQNCHKIVWKSILEHLIPF